MSIYKSDNNRITYSPSEAPSSNVSRSASVVSALTPASNPNPVFFNASSSDKSNSKLNAELLRYAEDIFNNFKNKGIVQYSDPKNKIKKPLKLKDIKTKIISSGTKNDLKLQFKNVLRRELLAEIEINEYITRFDEFFNGNAQKPKNQSEELGKSFSESPFTSTAISPVARQLSFLSQRVASSPAAKFSSLRKPETPPATKLSSAQPGTSVRSSEHHLTILEKLENKLSLKSPSQRLK
jgi:hypothetical protein